MREIIELSVDELTPTREEVLANQKMTGRNIPERIEKLLLSALDIFRQLARPKGLLEDIALPDFESIYAGDGLNSAEGPVPLIVPKANALALFAATMGNDLIEKSRSLFSEGGAALGYMLDAVNSSGAERLGKLMGQRFLTLIPEEQRSAEKMKVQYYSPGHCGWHMSGQTKLFQALKPEEIGITVNSRWVMQPIKSISGVLAAGVIDIHRFLPAFSFCKDCKEHKCVQRLLVLEGDN